MRKFEDVDIISVLRKIVDNNNLYYQTDFGYDAETLKTAYEGEHYLWMSRNSGTWLMHEHDAHTRNTYAYNTWQYYTDTKYYGVKAFAVEIMDNENGRPIGNIYELNYRKHIEEVRQNSFNAKTVEVVFKPNRLYPETTREFDVVEYNDNWRVIQDRYGQAESVKHILDIDDSKRLREVLSGIRTSREAEAVPASIGSFIRDMVRERFHDFGYTRGDMAFTTPEQAAGAIRHQIPVYILHPDNTAEQAKTKHDIDKIVYDGLMFGMGGRDKKLLNFFMAGNTLADLPFSHAELSAIFHMALYRGKENIEDEQQRKAVDGIIKVLDTILFADDGRGSDELKIDRELDGGVEL